MDSNVLKVLVTNAAKYLPDGEFQVFRNQVNEVYLQSELHTLYAGMPIDREMESWRATKIVTIQKQLALL